MIVSNEAGASCVIMCLTVFYFLFHLLNDTVRFEISKNLISFSPLRNIFLVV